MTAASWALPAMRGSLSGTAGPQAHSREDEFARRELTMSATVLPRRQPTPGSSGGPTLRHLDTRNLTKAW
jgi:hypothetical protein